MRDGSPARRQRIRDIAEQITALSDELRSLLLPDEAPPVPPPPIVPVVPVPLPPPPRPPSPPLAPRSLNPHATGFFLADDRVEITNSRNGLRGQLGTVLYTNPRFVFFRLDSTGDTVWRAARNLRRLHPPP